MIDPSMISDFTCEVQEHLDKLESCLLERENSVDDPAFIHAAFRAIHTIKGSAQLVGIHSIAELSHRLENLLELARQEKTRLNPEFLEILTAGRDRLAELVDDLQNFQEERTGIDDILDRITRYEAEYPHLDDSLAATDGTEASAANSDDREKMTEDENDPTEDLRDLFSAFEDDEETFEENPDMLDALIEEEGGIEEDAQEKTGRTSPLPESVHRFGGSNRNETRPSSSPVSPGLKDDRLEQARVLLTDIAALKKEIETEVFDEELMNIFITQLQDNISLLRTLTDTFDTAADQAQVINECSELISRLHSSANYMGYDRLTDFYGQWIAELEMTGMELSSGSPASLAFMERNFRTIAELFPQVEIIPSELTSIEPPVETETVVPPASEEDEQEAEPSEEEPALFSDLFRTDDGTEEDFFSENTEVIATLAEEEPQQPREGEPDLSAGGETPQKELEEKLDHFFGSDLDSSPVHPEADSTGESPAEKSSRPDRSLIDPVSLKKEIEEEEYDEELFDIFIQQLQENISLLRSLSEKFSETANKERLIKQCSDLLTALHSSANYMGYERLTDFYGQWIAELEMTDLQLSIGAPLTFDFMDEHIRTVIGIFPQIADVPAEKDPDQPLAPEGEGETGRGDIAADDDFEAIAAISGGEFEDAVGEEQETAVADNEDEDQEEPDERISREYPPATDEAGERRKELFERLSGALESLSVITPEPAVDDDIAPDSVQPEQAGPSGDDRELFARLSSALESDEDMQPREDVKGAVSLLTDEQLFNRLSSALEEQGIDRKPTGTKSIDDVINEILSGEGLAPPRQKSAQPGRTPQDNMSTQQTLERSVGADRRLILSDRRRGPEDRRLLDPLTPLQLKRSIRVDTDKIDNLMNHVEELVISRSNISQLYNEMGAIQEYLRETASLNPEELKPLRDYAHRLDEADTALRRVSSEIQEGVLNVRMVPAAYLFQRFPRFVGDLVRESDKKVKFRIQGEETELDKMILEDISDSLVHIIRNSIDHGIETIEERRSAGKNETANLLLEAYQESNTVVFEISDDGRGIDAAKIRKRVLEAGLLPAEKLEGLAESELLRLIMLPGCTTADKTTPTSGRGVGMDVVRHNVEHLGGTIAIQSQAGVGTMIRIKIPMTVSVIKTLAVMAGERMITLPLHNVVELTRVRQDNIMEADGIEVIRHRDSAVPVFRLAEILNIRRETEDTDHAYILIVKTKGERAGLLVDGFMRPGESVVKPLAEYLRKESGFSGATIREDGTISLILDIAALLAIVRNRLTDMQQKTALENSLKGLAFT